MSKLDELTVTTLHGFCQILIHSYAVEANIDPGAKMMDGPQAAAAFESVFDRWLRRRLSKPHDVSDPVVALSQQAPRKVAQKLKDLAVFRLAHLSAHTVRADLTERLDTALQDAAAHFRTWYTQSPSESLTARVLDQLDTLGQFYAGAFESVPSFTRLWEPAHPPLLSECMWARDNPRFEKYGLKTPRFKSAWKKVAGRETGERLSLECEAHFAAVSDCYRALLGRIATALVDALSGELDEVLADYAQFKRAAAVLDFDDLLQDVSNLTNDESEQREYK